MQPIRCFALLCCFHATHLYAVCATLIKGPVAINVLQCVMIQPEKAFPLTDNKYSFIRDLPPAYRKQFLDTYRGTLISGKVTRSSAIRSGLSPEKGALNGERILAFIEPGKMSCAAIQSKSVQGHIDEVCCEGGGAAPCLLGSGYLLKDPTLASGVSAASEGKSLSEVQAVHRQAKADMDRRDYKSAIARLEALKKRHALDAQEEYLLALSYREADRCQNGLPTLEKLYQRMEHGNNASEDELFVRRGVLLYARCLSLLSRPGEAVIVLQAFLVEPKKFEKEIRESLSHPDFGGIQTDKQYLIYRKRASRSLGM